MNIGDRVKLLREKKRMTQQELAYLLGYKSKSSVTHIERGRDIPRSMVVKLADILDTTPAYLMGWEEATVPPTEDKTYILESSKIRKIPIYESVSAGFGSSAQDYIIDYMPMFIESDSEAEETLGIKVKGNSMYPKIEDGDIVQVRKQSTVDNGRVAVVLIDGEDALVKRFYHEGNRIVLKSFNPEYPPRYFEREDMNRVQVLGLVQSVIKKL